MQDVHGKPRNVRRRRKGNMVWGLLAAIVLAATSIFLGCSPRVVSARQDIPADGETWVKIDSGRRVLVPSEDMMSLTRFQIDSILSKCEPENAPAVYCNSQDAELLTPDNVRKMVGTQ